MSLKQVETYQNRFLRRNAHGIPKEFAENPQNLVEISVSDRFARLRNSDSDQIQRDSDAMARFQI